jgi:sugar phosphate isomerase/epimerase
MYGIKLAINAEVIKETNIEKKLKLIKETGFEAFFTAYSDKIREYREYADRLGLIYNFIHAPFISAEKLWENGEAAKAATEELIQCVRDSAEIGVNTVVVHVYKGFDPSEGPNSVGIENYGKVVSAAETCGVRIAFENTEGEEYLAAIMDAFKYKNNVGFCWDSGHEQCYNYGKDMLALYGEKLFCTHLNDNLGVSRFSGITYWTDDLHLLPFDGIANWDDIALRLNRHNFTGPLTFELSAISKPGRHDNDQYAQLTMEQYYAQAYARACRVAAKRGIYGISSDY